MIVYSAYIGHIVKKTKFNFFALYYILNIARDKT